MTHKALRSSELRSSVQVLVHILRYLIAAWLDDSSWSGLTRMNGTVYP